MKTTFLVPLIGSLLVSLLPGCKAPQTSPKETIELSPLIGNWIIPGSVDRATSNIQFLEDGQFIITEVESGTMNAQGVYSVTSNAVTIQNGSESATGDCTLSATYTFTLDGDTVSFTKLLDDVCGPRVEQFNTTWSRK